MDIVANMGFVISIIVLVVAIMLMIYNIYKMSNLKVDDVNLADSMHDLLEDSFGDYAKMREYYQECQESMVSLRRQVALLEQDRKLLETARDAQDVLINDMIAQLATVTEAREVQGNLIQDMDTRLGKQEEGLREQEDLIVISFNYITYMHVEIEQADIEIDDIPAQLREWIEERKEK